MTSSPQVDVRFLVDGRQAARELEAVGRRAAAAAATPLPTIGMRRSARGIKMGWHVRVPLGGGWRLVVSPPRWSQERDRVLVTVREGLHGEKDHVFRGSEQLETRTPAEQIAWVEAQRLEHSPKRGYGPVSRLHLRELTLAALGDAMLAESAGDGVDGEAS
jgi:hypothetical protein